MAIIRCPECAKGVSDKASACPHCGYQLKATAQNTSGCGMFLLIVFAIITAVVILAIGL